MTIFLFTACSLVNEPYQDCPAKEKEDSVSLVLEMRASGTVTRTDDDPNHKEEDSEYRQLEDGIDFRDFGLFIFARLLSKTDEDEKLVLKITDITSPANKDVDIAGVPGDYTVTMDIPRSDLNKILFGEDSEEGINPTGKEQIMFRILIMANCTSSQSEWASIDGKTFEEVIDQLSGWSYDMDNLYNKDSENNDVQWLYTNTKKNLPMFGTNVFDISQKDLHNSRPDNRIYLGQIDLLRALAKVRVVDNIQNKNADGFPKIKSVEFIGSQNGARQLPNDASKYENGKQVHTPNIFNNSTEVTYTYRLGEMYDGMTSVSPADRKGAVHVGFVPEQKIGNGSGVQGIPGFKITIEYTENETMEFEVPMYAYNGKKFEFGDNILRNHIYTLSVDRAAADITLEAIEAPYNSVSLKPGFGELYYPEE